MSKQRHIIGRTVLELDTKQLADVWSLQEEVSFLFQQQGLPAMALLFDQLVGDEEVVRLERVEVEIGSIDRRFLGEEFIHNLVNVLRQTLGDRLTEGLLAEAKTEKTTRDRIGSDWEVLLYFLRYGRLPWWRTNHNWLAWLTSWSAVVQSDTNWRETLRELLLNYPAAQQRLVEQLPEALKHQLILNLQPTWTNWHNLLNQARKLMQSWELDKDAVRYLEQQAWLLLLREICVDNAPTRAFPTTWTRNWLTQLLQSWCLQQPPASLSDKQDIHQIIRQKLRATLAAVPHGEQSLWLTALDQVLNSISDITGRSHNLLAQVEELIKSFSLSDNIDKELFQQAWLLLLAAIGAENPSTRIPVSGMHNWLTNLLHWLETRQFSSLNQSAYQHLRSMIIALPLADHSPWLTALDQVLTTTSTNTIALSANWREHPILQTDTNSKLSKAEETGGLYINQAGLVLLHPFIRLYLEAVGLLDGETFRNETAQQTAIYLLYYLATKQTDAPEYELVLPKLLCGWPINQPVVRGLDLPATALEEGEHLLQTAIAYWEILKNTSPDGLREGFLQRPGKLTRSGESNWKLQVEQQAIDILLGSLPWGLSMVTLPWMEDLLVVEWT